MSSLKTLTRQSVEDAQPLTFDPSRRKSVITLHYHGVPVAIEHVGDVTSVEALVDKLLARAGWAAPSKGGTHPPRRERVEPLYQPDGTPCCPTHKKPLREGAYGLHCTAKDPEGKNGYCDLRFAE